MSNWASDLLGLTGWVKIPNVDVTQFFCENWNLSQLLMTLYQIKFAGFLLKMISASSLVPKIQHQSDSSSWCHPLWIFCLALLGYETILVSMSCNNLVIIHSVGIFLIFKGSRVGIKKTTCFSLTRQRFLHDLPQWINQKRWTWPLRRKWMMTCKTSGISNWTQRMHISSWIMQMVRATQLATHSGLVKIKQGAL